MNRQPNHKARYIVNLTQHQSIFSKKQRENRTCVLIHAYKPIGLDCNESSWKFTVRLCQSSCGWVIASLVFSLSFANIYITVGYLSASNREITISKSQTVTYDMVSRKLCFKCNKILKLVLNSTIFPPIMECIRNSPHHYKIQVEQWIVTANGNKQPNNFGQVNKIRNKLHVLLPICIVKKNSHLIGGIYCV